MPHLHLQRFGAVRAGVQVLVGKRLHLDGRLLGILWQEVVLGCSIHCRGYCVHWPHLGYILLDFPLRYHKLGHMDRNHMHDPSGTPCRFLRHET